MNPVPNKTKVDYHGSLEYRYGTYTIVESFPAEGTEAPGFESADGYRYLLSNGKHVISMVRRQSFTVLEETDED